MIIVVFFFFNLMSREDSERLSFYPLQHLRKFQANLHLSESPSSPHYLICNMTAVFYHKVNGKRSARILLTSGETCLLGSLNNFFFPKRGRANLAASAHPSGRCKTSVSMCSEGKASLYQKKKSWREDPCLWWRASVFKHWLSTEEVKAASLRSPPRL